jgi:signal transduction histidine kinase
VQYEEKIRQVITGVDAMNRIIEQLLQLSRLDAGNLEIRKVDIKLFKLVREICQKRNQEMSDKRINLKISIPESAVVIADQAFLEIMVDNLVSNSVKYIGEAGEIVCSWNEDERKLAVTDNGPGIPKEQLPLLFDRFYRTDESRSSAVQGHGLGLAIVKMLADIQKINIAVTSGPGEGTTFTLAFPG